MTMEKKIKHLEMIQGIITRMAGNLFLLKGWSVTLIVALFAIIGKGANTSSLLFSFGVLFIFWILDGYFLSMERCYRSLYDDVRKKTDEEIDFSMDFRPFVNGRNKWLRSIFSKTLVIFYGTLLFIMILVTLLMGVDKITFSIDMNSNIQPLIQIEQ